MSIGIIRIVRSFGHRQLYNDYNRTKEGAIAVEHIVMDMEWKVVVKRLVYALTDELRTDYQQCMEQAAAWSKYVIPAYSF